MANTKSSIEVGVSSCLLGEMVRWDGDHRRDHTIADIFGAYFTFVPVCPEFETNMGVPREPVHLEGELSAPHMIGNESGEDWTARMNRFAAKRVRELQRLNLSGYLLKKGSPSCGMHRVPVTNAKGTPVRRGHGLFARELLARMPLLPVEDEDRLNDAHLRENFIVRVFAYHRLRKLITGRFSRGRLVAFHSQQNLLLMAHGPRHAKELDRLVAAVDDYRPAAFKQKYSELYMTALTVKATTTKNVKVLQHVLGYLRHDLQAVQRQDILRVIDDYRNNLVPLIVPLTLLRHHLAVYGIGALNDQIYLHPHPEELALRNHV